MRHVFTFKNFSALLLFILIPFNAFSSWELSFRGAFAVPSAVVDSALQNAVDKAFQNQDGFSKKYDVVSINDVFPIQIQGLQISVKGGAGSQKALFKTLEAGRRWKIDLPVLDLSVTADRVYVSHTLRTTVGGVNLNLNMQADCPGISAHSRPQLTSASVELKLDGDLHVQIEKLEIKWQGDSWVLDPITCTGTQGFGEQVKQKLSALMNDPAQIKGILEAEIQKFLQNSVNDQVQILYSGLRQIQMQSPGFNMHIEPENKIIPLTGGFYIPAQGKISLPLDPSGSSAVAPFEVGEESSIFSGLEPSRLGFVFPDSVVLELLKHIHSSGLLNFDFYSRQIPAFVSLMKSRFMQFFLFPDLMNYARSSVFTFKTYFDKGIEAEFSGHDSDVASLKVKGVGHLYMYAPRENSYVPYIDFEIPFDSSITLESGSQDGLGLNFRNLNLKVNPHWDGNYVQKYSPNKSIWTRVLASQATQYLTSAPLPIKLDFIQNAVLKRHSSKNLLWLQFNLK